MNFKQLKPHLQQQPLANCYLLQGEDNYLLSQAQKSIESAVGVEYEELNYSKFSDNTPISAVVAALQVLPFLSKYRLAVLKEFYPNAADAKLLAEQFLKADDLSTILMIVNNKNCEGLKKYDKYMQFVDCSYLDIDSCTEWVKKRMNLSRIAISSENAALIAEYSQRDMAAISLQCEKLISYLSAGDTVTRELIDDNVIKHEAYRIYEFTDAVSVKNRTKAYTIMENMLQNGNSETAMLAALYKHFRGLLFVSITPAASAELAKNLEVPEFAVRRMQGQAKKFTPKALKEIITVLSETEYKLKSGQLGSGTFFKFLILRLINIQ